MATKTVTVRARSQAAPDAVWAVLADARAWPRWTRMSDASLEAEGEPAPDGLGAIRRFTTGRIVAREQVVTWEPPRRFGYRLLSGLPLDDYVATVALEPAPGGGTAITWSATFTPRKPGMRLFVWVTLRDISRRLARTAANTARVDQSGG